MTGVGAPWYTSGAQVWNGAADTLNPNPATTNTMPRVTTDTEAPPAVTTELISVRRVEPEMPNSSDIP